MDVYFGRKVKGSPFKRHEEMQYEGIRLTTFKDWPSWGSVWPTLLAKAGFFYTKTADQVACFCCGGRLKTWEAGASPMTEHKRFFPQCTFVTGRDNTNVPLGGSSVESPPVTSGGQDRQRHNTHAPSNHHSSLASYAGASAATNDRPSLSLAGNAQAQQQAPWRGQHESLLGLSATGGIPGQQHRKHMRNGPVVEAPEVSSDGRGGLADSHQQADANSRRHHTPPSLQSLLGQQPHRVQVRQTGHDLTAELAIPVSVVPRLVVGPNDRLVIFAFGSGDIVRITVPREVAQNSRQYFLDALTTFYPPGSHIPQQLLQQLWALPQQHNDSPTHLDEVSAVVSAADGNPVTLVVTPTGAQRTCDVCHVHAWGVRGRCLPCEHLYCERCAVTNHQSSRCVVCGTTIGIFAMDV